MLRQNEFVILNRRTPRNGPLLCIQRFKFSSFSQSIIPLCQRVFGRKPETKDQFLILGHAGQQLELTDQISFGDWTKMNLCIFALAILLEIDQVRRTRFDEIHHLLLNRLKSFEISNF